ncbi:MAG TPA: hypothetical protein VF179_30455 [Thermoanaerobaculia bacterium]|nr:hypothetical protein [Thermoanaerobaculia bacterium]
MDLKEMLKQANEVATTVLPWLTGGLAGAILTYFLNRRLTKRSRPRLQIRVLNVNYTVPKHHESFAELQVSYAGNPYAELSYHELSVENISSRVIKEAPFVIQLGRNATILDLQMSSEPIPHEIVRNQDGLEAHQHRFTFRDLLAGDVGRIRLLIAGSEAFNWYFRGADEIDIISGEGGSVHKVEEDIRTIVAWIALYVLLGVIPTVASVLRSLLILLSGPYLFRLGAHWLRPLFGRRGPQAHGPIIVGQGRVLVEYNQHSGVSEIVANFNEKGGSGDGMAQDA